ncbi:MAG TPA: SRPBCC family protein [Anaerolineae bacterium]|nr:SRPBCC family protein [Anaerolineae bacterium]
MWSNKVSIDIAAAPEKVFRYLADFARHGEWSMSVTTLEQITPGPIGVGTEFKSSETLPQEFVSFAKITALDAPRRVAWESTDHQVFRTNWEFEISPNAGGTHLVQRVTFHPISDFGKEFLSVRNLQVEPENLKSLARLKQILEN